MKNNLLDIFSKLQKDEKPDNIHLNSRVLIIDGLNLFLRNFAVINRLNLVGHEIGGIVGFLKSLGSTIKLLNPTRVVVVFDGENGSSNRKYLYPQYKANRATSRIMNSSLYSNKNEEDDSKYDQIVRLVDYLSYLPLLSISIDNLEADDIIAHLANTVYSDITDSHIYVMSTDNDFIQLVNDRISVYSPMKKRIYQVNQVLSDFKVHPNNFLLYKALIGDASDNIPGVHGVGKSNVYKLFSFLTTSEERSLQDLMEVCSNPPKKSKIYERVLNVSKDIQTFYNVMDLKNPNISEENKTIIKDQYANGICDFKKYEFLKLYKYDKFGDAIPNVENWINLYTSLNNYKQL